jgi:hypothetical protein
LVVSSLALLGYRDFLRELSSFLFRLLLFISFFDRASAQMLHKHQEDPSWYHGKQRL